jgi:hypothetical protein
VEVYPIETAPAAWQQLEGSFDPAPDSVSAVLHQSINRTLNGSQEGKLFDCAPAQFFHSSGGTRKVSTMRDEFASKGFLAVAVAGLFLLCSGFVAFAFT